MTATHWIDAGVEKDLVDWHIFLNDRALLTPYHSDESELLDFIVSVVYLGTPTHHVVTRSVPGGVFCINGAKCGHARSIAEVCKIDFIFFLGKKSYINAYNYECGLPILLFS